MTSVKHSLKIDWATHAAAKYACENWHYSGCLPAGKLVKVGAWEDGKFVGVVLFGRGANNQMSAKYNLTQDQCVELVRIALTKHKSQVSRIASLALRFLAKSNQGIRLVVSYADPKQGHHGGIYQAGNWIYAGHSTAQRELLINGVHVHKRSAFSMYGTSSADKIAKKSGKKVEYGPVEWKHIYLMPLDNEMRQRIMPLARPYPKRAKQAMDGDHPSQRQGGTDPHAPLDSLEASDATG